MEERAKRNGTGGKVKPRVGGGGRKLKKVQTETPWGCQTKTLHWSEREKKKLGEKDGLLKRQ